MTLGNSKVFRSIHDESGLDWPGGGECNYRKRTGDGTMNEAYVTLGGSNRLYRKQVNALQSKGFEIDSGFGTGHGHWSNRWHTVSHPTQTSEEILSVVRALGGRKQVNR